MKNRIKEVRMDSSLNMTEFANRIGTAANTISTYESGTRVPSNAVIVSICREFNVNEDWLRTGNGDKYIAMTDNQALLSFVNELAGQDDSPIKRILLKYAKLSPENKKIVENAIKMFMDNKE